MDRNAMLAVLQHPPVRITMNDGSVHVVDRSHQFSCSDIALVYLAKDEEDGKWRHVYLPLVTMAEVVTIAPAA